MTRSLFLLLLLVFALHTPLAAQEKDSLLAKKTDVDVIDVLSGLLNTKWASKHDSLDKKTGRVYFSGAPSVGYSLTSGASAIFVGDFAYFASELKNQKISIIYTDVLYTQKEQFVFRIQNNLWTKNNRFNIVSDWRYYWYPQKTYGLGNASSLAGSVDQLYSYVRLHQSVLKSFRPNWYVGMGIAWDYRYDIIHTIEQNEANQNVLDQIDNYGLTKQSNSTGLLFNLLFDNRINSINSHGGKFMNIIYRPNFTFLGSDGPWQMMMVDLRKYIPFPKSSENVLALWSYNWFTFGGNPPYLDLPATGWDMNSNLGRGYIQGRFRSKSLIYLESEYRFKILRNGLLGGVAFCNAQSVTGWPDNNFSTVALGVGAGLRLKFNKYSRANVCIDYGFGQGGSQGVFVNLGEVF